MTNAYNLSDYNYDLPEELIAQVPSQKRDMSSLMVLEKDGSVSHKHFYDIIDYLNKGDALVLNNSKVIPARIFGKRFQKDEQGNFTGTLGTDCEVLLLERKQDTVWEALVRPGKKLVEGDRLKFSDKLEGRILKVLDDGNRLVEFFYEGEFFSILDEIGEMPLPPYIHSRESQKDRYQTVYAKHEGSSAAPTAGLHFTDELIERIKQKGVEIIYVTLHVGLGTFRPVKEQNILNHKMHSEYYTVTKDNAEKFNTVKKNGGRIFCVGTTSCRTVESCADQNGFLSEKSATTDIFIYPGYKFKAMDSLITNFHLPQSTLIMLVSALAGRERVLEAYKTAVEKRYRFFSFGDAMLIV